MSFGGAVAHNTLHDVLPLPQIATTKTSGESTPATAADTGGAGRQQQSYPQQVREIRGVLNSDCWECISVFLGTDVYKRRVLCVLASPFAATSISSTVVGILGGKGTGVYNWLSGSKDSNAPAPNSGMVKKSAEDMIQAGAESSSVFESAMLSLVGSLLGALEDEKLTAAYIGQGCVDSIASIQKKQQNGDGSIIVEDLEYKPPPDLVCHNTVGNAAARVKVLDSLVDPLFVRDLMGSYAQELRL